ncbi:gibberellin 20 oxidase 2-like [Salvia miltiorrhiza]|uniref:gibberellin 20 oxidase 2-like n=1 Tax=Salvia miltiorrhiza TaxID=226208 RepID=UPI0025ACA3F8|nr:gibberellin 20 oxidase 2-like [Salvia miltiorrhiza]
MDSNTAFDSFVYPNFSKLDLEKFIWPKQENHSSNEELNEPLIDLEGGAAATADLVRSACLRHGLFQVINHGVDLNLINSVNDHVNFFFNLPIDAKMRVHRLPGSFWGYSFAHADRFSLNLPWKEIFSCIFRQDASDSEGGLFFESAFGHEFQKIRLDFEKYCDAMKKLSLSIMEILGMSLGVDKVYYKDFFEDGSSLLRCNFYPRCEEAAQTLGTGPHCDPTALTILYQDQVGGLQVFVDDRWKSVTPRPGALVVNLGDTFSALSNGVYKSCPHRAVVNKSMERVSMVYFLCPAEEKVIKPPTNLVSSERLRQYPDFKWLDFLNFTQKHYRVDVATLQNFTKWLISHQPT